MSDSNKWDQPDAPPPPLFTGQKERDLIRLADVYLENLQVEVPARFDIIAIILNEVESHITHFEDAFSPITFNM